MIRTGFIAAAFALAASCGGGSSAPATHFTANLGAPNEPGSVVSSGTGTATYTVIGSVGYTNTGATITYAVTFQNLTAAASAGHIHVGAAGVNGTVTVPFTVPANTSGTFSGSISATDVRAASGGGVSVAAGSIDDLLAAMRAGNTYTNIHTSTYPNGEIRGQNQPN